MRLTPQQQRVINDAAARTFDPDAYVILFGARLDDPDRGMTSTCSSNTRVQSRTPAWPRHAWQPTSQYSSVSARWTPCMPGQASRRPRAARSADARRAALTSAHEGAKFRFLVTVETARRDLALPEYSRAEVFP